MGKTKKYTLLKAIFRYSLRNFVKLNNIKLSKMFYASYKSSINYQKNSIIKGKIKTNEHFDNTFTVNE